jgi:ketosteroid isomerase-like protein
MKKISFFVLLSCAFSVAFSQPNDLEIIKKTNLDWIHAYPKKDTAALSRIFADDIIFINTLGVRLKKNEILLRIMEPGREYVSATLDSLLEAKIIGNTCIVIGKTTFVRKLEGVQSEIKSSYMSIYEKRKGKWLIVASHFTLLNAK